MPLYIKDPDVADMAETLRRLTHARTKTEAVRDALRKALSAEAERAPLAARLHNAVLKAQRIGARNPAHDHKSFTDEMWGG